jgi:hypothetical protein
MNRNRFFYVLVALALAVMAALTARQVVVTADTVPTETSAPSASDDPLCPFTEAERASIRAEYLPEARGSWLRSDTGFLGYEGGLLMLLHC